MNHKFFDAEFKLSEENFHENVKNEASVHFLIQSLSKSYLKTLILQDSSELEAMDIHKANLPLFSKFNLELPLYLKNYVQSESFSSTPQNSIFVKIGNEGIKYFGSIFENSILNEVLTPSVSVRHTNVSSKNEVLVLEENGSSGISYQFLLENEKEMYLSLKLAELEKPKFDQVILKKDNRFIYSKSFDLEGQISFSGLGIGKYNIELIGKSNSKRFDLNLLSE